MRVEVPAHPGRVRWRVEFVAAAERASLLAAAAPREGEVEAAAGETVEVVVPVEPPAESLYRSGDASPEGQVVVREERDAHPGLIRAFPGPCRAP